MAAYENPYSQQYLDINKQNYKSRHPDHPDNSYDQKNAPNLSDADMYLNLTVHNFADNKIPCSYTENRKKAILLNGKDWKMSVVRLDVPSQEIPLFYWPGDTEFKITIAVVDDANNEYTQEVDLTYVPREDPNPTGNDRAIWTVDQMVRSINIAIDLACAGLPIGCPLRSTTTLRPRLVYDPEAVIFSIRYPPLNLAEGGANVANWNNLAWTTARAVLIFNQSLDFLFESFPKVENTVFKFSTYKVYNQYNNWKSSLRAGTPATYDYYYEMKQEHSSLNLWFELYKIVITSDMEIRKEYIGVSSDINNDRQVIPDSLNSRGILTDFDIGFLKPTAQRINYTPTAEYRFIDILKDGELSFIDFKIWYQTQNGTLRPLYLEPGQSANIKLLFRKK